MINSKHVKDLIKEAIIKLDYQIDGGSPASLNAPNHELLLMFRSRLESMLCEVETNQLPLKHDRKVMGHLIVDSLPFDSIWGEAFLKAEHKYMEL